MHLSHKCDIPIIVDVLFAAVVNMIGDSNDDRSDSVYI